MAKERVAHCDPLERQRDQHFAPASEPESHVVVLDGERDDETPASIFLHDVGH